MSIMFLPSHASSALQSVICVKDDMGLGRNEEVSGDFADETWNSISGAST